MVSHCLCACEGRYLAFCNIGFHSFTSLRVISCCMEICCASVWACSNFPMITFVVVFVVMLVGGGGGGGVGRGGGREEVLMVLLVGLAIHSLT